jgi:hypothetical protein
MHETSPGNPAAVLQKIIDLEPVMGFDPRTLPRPVLRAIWAGMDALNRESAALRFLEESREAPLLEAVTGSPEAPSRPQA